MKVGFIGLGAMGMPMAENLARAGRLHAAWNRTTRRAEALAAQSGIAVAASPAELAARCDCIITCVSADADLEQVITAMLPGLRPGTIIVDASTVRAQTVIDLNARLATHEVRLLDAPVSGGVEGARHGELVFMVGGDEQALEQVRPALQVMGKQITWMGPSGSGQATKAVNQIMAAGINQAVTEALAFAEGMQLPLEKVVEVISGGAAGNWFLQQRGASMTRGEYAPGFRVALHKKDLDICREMAEAIAEHDMRLPVIEMTRVHYARLIEQGFGDEDISALFRLKRALFGGPE
ncbi:MAG: NAD(P)-dependent oxidoreductase [Granulosicoccaceae bacterium]